MIIKIAGIELSDFTVNDITFNYDAVSNTFSLTTPFFEHWAKSKKIFKPLSYPVVEIFDNRRRKILTGNILNHTFRSNANGNEIALSGYSKTGILDDCPDASNSLTENGGQSTCYEGLSLRELAGALVKPFNIEVTVDDLVSGRMDEPIEQFTTDPSKSVALQLAALATLKNIVMRSTPDGKLLFTQVDPAQKPEARFSTGDGVVNEISLQVNGQAMHSCIGVTGSVALFEDDPEDMEKAGGIQEIVNPLVGLFRPKIVKQGSETGAIEETAKATLAGELGNITVEVQCKGWKIIDDHALSPGDLISVKSPDVYLYDWTTLLVRKISLKESANEKTSTLSCVLPETMTGNQPKLIFD